MSEKPKAQLDWSLTVECPKCKNDFDAVEQDACNDNSLANLVFNNKWDLADGRELVCPACDHEFEIGGIEY